MYWTLREDASVTFDWQLYKPLIEDKIASNSVNPDDIENGRITSLFCGRISLL